MTISLGDILSFISIAVAVITFFVTRHRTQKVETLQKIDELTEGYYDVRDKDVSKDYKEYVSYLSKLDRFAKAVNQHVYMERVVKKHDLFFKTLYQHGFIQKLVPQRRKQFKRESYYQDLEIMLKKLGVCEKIEGI